MDRGVAAAIATSDGVLVDRQFCHRRAREAAHGGVAAQAFPRGLWRGRNRDKTRAALAELRARERHRRVDFCAQLTAYQLAASNAVVVLEDLTRHRT